MTKEGANVMRFFCLATILAIVLIGCAPDSQSEVQPGAVADESEHHQIFHPGDIEWGDAPPAFEPGAEMAILEGDPSVEGEVYTLRLRLPAGYEIAPHSHPLPERAVILSGEMYLGHGEEIKMEDTERIEAGTYLTIPPEMVHYVINNSEEETVLHITSVGPLEVNYVNPDDDPRLR